MYMYWQFNIRVWHWPWHVKDETGWQGLFAHYAGIGPFQWHWYSYNGK